MLNRFALAVVALAAAATSPSAQNLPAPIWTGLYVGAHLGGGWGELSQTSALDISGVAGGGQIGYNYQFNQVVLGVEADASITNIGDELRATAGGVTVRAEVTNSFLASVRGRIGLAVGPALIYGTGGFAQGHFKLDATATNGIQTVTMVQSFNHQGYVFGGGIEYMFSQHLVGRFEGLRYQFNELNGSTEDYKVDVLRAGLSYKY